MKICVATMKGGGLDDFVSGVFGRCQTFTFVDVDENEKEIKNFEVVQNEFAGAMGGAGIQAAQLVVNKKANIVIAGNFGPKAFQILSQVGMKIVSVQGINVRDAVVKYLNGELEEITQATSPLYGGRIGQRFGMGRGAGRGRGGMGMGRGM
jgi:predicted Fe-Mo cluster-binding NifX family protein